MERDGIPQPYLQILTNFNSHAHVERDVKITFPVLILKNFNSHAHVERDSKLIIINIYKNISTHTLTWSVTRIHD